MKLLELNLPSPAENLAADEALLELCEIGAAGETLVFWEPRSVFVVVGYANKLAMEVNVETCERRGVPVFRRCSGGGTVVQMPGGVNYSLLLPITETGPTRNIGAANQFIMEKNRAAIAELLPAATVSVRGHTDLCLGDLKFAGNSQRRRKHFLLFHGTLLVNCNLGLISELLQMPSLQPDYRASRPHENFVTNLNLPVQTVKAALAQAWNASGPAPLLPATDIARLVTEKYSTPVWNLKF